MSSHPSSSAASSTHSSRTFIAATVAAVAGFGALTAAYLLSRKDDKPKPKPPSSSSFATGSSSQPLSAAIHDQFLEKLEKYLHKLEVSDYSDLDFDSVSESAALSSSTNAALRPLKHATKKLARLLRNIRQLAGSERKCREKSIHILHRIAMAKFLLEFHRSSKSHAQASSISISPMNGTFHSRSRQIESETKDQQERQEDLERGWKFLEGREMEADMMEVRLNKEKSGSSTRPVSSSAASSSSITTFPSSTVRQQLTCTALKLATELHQPQRMWQALTQLLAIDGEAESTISQPGAIHPILISKETLLSLDRGSLLTCYEATALLGHFLWTFQLGQRLFAARQTSASPALATLEFGQDRYEEMHSQALIEPDLIDFAVVSEMATQHVLRLIQHDPTLKERLEMIGPIQPSVLPFDESGRTIHESAPAQTSAEIPSSSTSTPLFDGPPLTSLIWSEYDIRAYSARIESIETTDANLKRHLLNILKEPGEHDMHYFASSKANGNGHPIIPTISSSSTAITASDLSSPTGDSRPTIVIPPVVGPVRKIYRAGALFHSTGLFGQAIPLVGTTLPSSLTVPGLATSGGLRFSLSGYCHVEPMRLASPLAGGSVPVQLSYSQFEYYAFQQPSGEHSRTSSSVSAIDTPPQSGTMTPPRSLTVPSSNLSSSMSSPIGSPSQQYLLPDSHGQLSSPNGHHSTHLFDSASFASIHPEHFEHKSGGEEATAAAAAATIPEEPEMSPPISISASSVTFSPIQQYAASLGPHAQLWRGIYRAIQDPTTPTAADSTTSASADVTAGATSRPRIEVTYSISIVVEPCQTNAINSTETNTNESRAQD